MLQVLVVHTGCLRCRPQRRRRRVSELASKPDPIERQFRTDEQRHPLNRTTLETSDGVSPAALKNDRASAGKSRRALLLDPETTATAPDTPEASGYRMGTMCLDRRESVEARFA